MLALALDPNVVIPLIFSALAFLTVIGLALPWLQPDFFATRLKVIRERRAELNRQRRERLERGGLRRVVPVDTQKFNLGWLLVDAHPGVG